LYFKVVTCDFADEASRGTGSEMVSRAVKGISNIPNRRAARPTKNRRYAVAVRRNRAAFGVTFCTWAVPERHLYG
jgi:hypothetical protein